MNHVSPLKAMATNDPDESDQIRFLRTRMARFPDRIGIRLRLARLLEEEGDTQAAEDLLRETASRSPGNPRARTDLQEFLDRHRLPDRGANRTEDVFSHATPAAVSPEPTGVELPACAEAGSRQTGDPVSPAAPWPEARDRVVSAPSIPAVLPIDAFEFADVLDYPMAPAPETVTATPGERAWAGMADTSARRRPAVPAADTRPVPAHRAFAALPQRRRPPVELAVSLGVVAVVALLGVLSQHLPSGVVLQPSPEAGLLHPSSDTLVADKRPESRTILASTDLSAAAPVVQTRALDGAVPTLVVAATGHDRERPAETSPLPSLADPPTATPIAVTVFYAERDVRAATAAEDAATRLRRGGTPATSVGVPHVRPGSAGIGYYFDEDRPGAMAVSNLLGGLGPVHPLARSKTDLPAPGEVALVLP